MAHRVIEARYAGAALLACAVSAGCNWPWQHDMADQPSPPAAAGPRSPAPGAIPREARGPFDRVSGESVSSPLAAGSTAKGEALYRIYCVPCHEGPVGQYFPKMPQLAGPDVQQHGDGWLYATITNGTDLMPAYGHELDPAERWQIVGYLRSLAR
jgi:S-disulfanyl-L-cysteine oxidoreductase SoxD